MNMWYMPFIMSYSYHCHQSCRYTNQWAHCDDHQGELPSTNKPHHEAKHKSRNSLYKDRDLVGDGIVDLVYITGKETEHAAFRDKDNVIRSPSADKILQLTQIFLC